jgi:molybdopterin-guanine dinucleotide biosynthesis protein A
VTPAGVVLTGGASRRMGADKSLLEVDGVAMALRVATALADSGCRPVLCQGGDAVALSALGLTVVPDSEPGCGPVAAIVDALTGHAGDVVVCACDVPWLDAVTVSRLLAAAGQHPEAHVIVATDTDGPHLLACWRAHSRPQLADLLAQGVRSYRAALQRLQTVYVDVPAEVVVNINKPEDLRRRR